MSLNTQSLAVLRVLESRAPLVGRSVAEVRAASLAEALELAGPPAEVAEVREIAIPGPAGEIGARSYRPHAGPVAGVLVWMHGGGFAFGSLDESDGTARALALASGCLVVSVAYRLAPESPFPAGVEDCYAATSWVAGQLGALDAAGRRLAVGGDSAGGTLATAVAMMARDRGGPAIDFQLLAYPVTCCRALDVPSRRQTAAGHHPLEALEWVLSLYVAEAGDAEHPLASPLLAVSLHDLPPALVVTAEHDLLRDEGERYAARLVAAGVPVTARRWLGVMHGFMAQDRFVDAAGEAIAEAGLAVRRALERTAAA